MVAGRQWFAYSKFGSYFQFSFSFVSFSLIFSRLYSWLGLAATLLLLFVFLLIVFLLPYRFVATHQREWLGSMQDTQISPDINRWKKGKKTVG